MTHPHLVRYIHHDDVDVVLGRLPFDLRARLRGVHLTSTNFAVRKLGWVTRHDRREITLCPMLPPRVSLRGYMFRGRIASDFGAPERGQWPPWAVRRYLLYNTLLHELGHMQIIDGEYASETRAQDFAHEWRGRLYSEPFDHPDPIHNAPTPDELATIPMWNGLDKLQRLRITERVLRPPGLELTDVRWPPLEDSQARFLQRVLGSRRRTLPEGTHDA